MRTRLLVVLLLASAAAPAMAQDAPSPAGQRYPQPVRVGDLDRRLVLQPTEQQTVLGRVSGVVRQRDGTTLVVVDAGGLLGFGTHAVAVPAEAMALLGEHLALLGLTPRQFADLAAFDPAGTIPVPQDETIRMDLTRPFH